MSPPIIDDDDEIVIDANFWANYSPDPNKPPVQEMTQKEIDAEKENIYYELLESEDQRDICDHWYHWCVPE